MIKIKGGMHLEDQTWRCDQCKYTSTIAWNKMADWWRDPVCAMCLANSKAPTEKMGADDIKMKKSETKERLKI